MLLVRPIPLDDESLGSILMRATYLNGWPDTRTMIRATGSKYLHAVNIFLGGTRFENRLNNLGITLPSHLHAFQLKRTMTCKMMTFNERVEFPMSIFRREGGALCPLCVQANSYLKQSWALRLISTCEQHECLLIKQCPECNEALDWNRPGPHLCRCSFDLREAPIIPGDATVAKSVLLLIQSEDQEMLNQVSENFLALESFYSGQITSLSEEKMNALSSYGRSHVLQHLADYVTDRADIEHPRVALMPLLINHGIQRDIATEVLQLISDIPIPSRSQFSLDGVFNPKETAAALGLSKTTYLTSLLHAHLLGTEGYAKASQLMYTKKSIDFLLRRLWTPKNDINSAIRKHPLTETIAKLAVQVLAFPELNAGYNLEKGICGLRRLKETNIKPSSIQYRNFLTVEGAANQLNAYPRVIRSLVSNKYLTGRQLPYQGKRIFISKEQLTQFDQSFVFVGILAKKVGASKTQFIQYLASHGVRPVGGPNYDGLCVYLIQRESIADLDLANLNIKKIRDVKLKKEAPNSEPVIPVIPDNPQYITVSEAARQLKLSVILVTTLLRQGVFIKYPARVSAVAVTRESFETFRNRMFDRSYERLQKALAVTGETRSEFIRKWVTTGIVNVVQIGSEEGLTKKHFKKIQSLKRNYVTAKDAAIEFSRGKHLLPNLEVRGLLKSVKIGKEKVIKLYKRRDINKLISKGLLNSI
ncbi:TniQ family protein [Undibacterium sp.]|uniref:TniQ family protein n=1 Tax=Undibacterium sp. TaxID=1914977 RepID=UPI0025E5EEA8|nr:TniQ family protein [Undibacterium sp.]